MPQNRNSGELLPYPESPTLNETRRCLVARALADMGLVKARAPELIRSSHVLLQADIWDAARAYNATLLHELFDIGDATGIAQTVLREDTLRAQTYREFTEKIGLTFDSGRFREVSAERPLALSAFQPEIRIRDAIETRNTRVIIEERDVVAASLRAVR